MTMNNKTSPAPKPGHERKAPSWLAAGQRMSRSPACQVGLALLVLLSLLWGVIAWDLQASKARLELENSRDTSSLLRLYAEEVRSSIHAVDLTILGLRDRWQDEGFTHFAGRVLLQQKHLERDVIFQVAIINAQGRLAFSSADPYAAPIDLSDREHFRMHRRADATDTLFVSKPVFGRITKRWTIQLTRRLTDAQGQFAGVIVISIPADYFTRFSRAVDLGEGSAVSMLRNSGELLTRAPPPPQGMDASIQQFPERLARMEQGRDEIAPFPAVSDIDGVKRLFAAQRLREYGLVMLMGRSAAVLMEPYERLRLTYLIAGSVISALLLLVGYMLVASLRQRARTRESLERSEFRWKHALKGASDGVWDWDIASGTVYFSEDWRKMLGYAPHEVSGDPQAWREVTHPEDVAATSAALRSCLAGVRQEYSVEFRMRHRDGSWRWVHSRGVVVQHAREVRPQRMIGTFEDITQRKLAEEAMQLAVLVYEHSHEGLLVMDADNVILSVNRAFSELTGYGAEEIVGQTIDTLLRVEGQDEQPRFETLWRQVRATGEWQGDIWSRRKNGGVYAEWLSISTVFDREQRPHRRVALFSNLASKKEYEQILWQQAHCDPLTGLLNRRIFRERLERDLVQAAQDGRSMALLYLDLDYFKEVNDALGHSVGDSLLQEAAQRLRDCVAAGDSVARLGGDEFAITTGALAPTELAQAILRRMSEPFVLGTETAFVSGSIGITTYPRGDASAETLLRDADQAMYAAKALGRNGFQEFTPSMQESAQQRMRLTADLRSAVGEHQLRLVYQPIVQLATGLIHKAEALVRWEHPARGLVSPAEFIPIAEKTEVIHALGDWVFEQAATNLRQLRALHHPGFQMSINTSPAQFTGNRQLCENWLRVLREMDLPGSSIAIEITEGMLLDASATGGLRELLASVQAAGIQLSLDDFGTGYSSLSYLKKFNMDYLKIDQSFVRNLNESSSDLALCRAIITMAHALGLRVVAEGIETDYQRDLLKGMGCDYGQGYLFSKPVPYERLAAMLQDARGSQQAREAA
ncbi:hypothetical protein ASF94_03960 [Acidovorax sp. Leaf160]|nr:hypothetical protein ASF94_03960 [Acidovorax sp. Leaf160]